MRIRCNSAVYYRPVYYRPVLAAVIASVALSSGCGTPTAEFRENAVAIVKQEVEVGEDFDTARKQQIADVLVALFGTPDAPHVPEVGVDLRPIMDANKLRFAAGPVSSDERGRARGLYREHCAHCHGITGDGAGPTAEFLNPYPRDYRQGIFKFKSTPKGQKPTHDDLHRTLVNGIPGTAMPSFLVLPENELEALAHYVRYLSVRGEVELLLIDYVANELDPDQPLMDPAGPSEAQDEQAEIIRSLVVEIADKWSRADALATPVPAPGEDRDLLASVARGRELFYGPIANCVKCHGDTALGDGQTTDYDDWSKMLDPGQPEMVEKFVSLGALPPRQIHPRNLRLGVFRGGRRPVDLYWRIRNGIDGTPMPGALMKPEGSGPEMKGLTEADLWCLIDYVRSLPYEPLSNPRYASPTFQRERM